MNQGHSNITAANQASRPPTGILVKKKSQSRALGLISYRQQQARSDEQCGYHQFSTGPVTLSHTAGRTLLSTLTHNSHLSPW